MRSHEKPAEDPENYFWKKKSHSNLQGWTQYQNAKTERGHEKSAEDSVESPALKGKKHSYSNFQGLIQNPSGVL